MSNTQVSVGVGGCGAPRGLVTGAKPQCHPCAVEANEDYEDYVYEELPAKDDPDTGSQTVTPLQLFERRRSRRRREAPKVADEQESRVQYTVCIWWVLGAAPDMGELLGWETEAGPRLGLGICNPVQVGPGHVSAGGKTRWGSWAWPLLISPC